MATTINKDLEVRLKKIDKIRSELKKEEKSASKDILDMLKTLMKENPLLTGLKWQQYTPGFNDGEPCTFGVHGPYFKFDETIVPHGDQEDDYDSGWFDDYSVDKNFFKEKSDILNYETIKELEKTVKAAQKAFTSLEQMESQLQDMFGDGMEITVTKDGVESEDYDHD